MHQSLNPTNGMLPHTRQQLRKRKCELGTDGSPDVVHPVEPGFEVVVGDDLQFSIPDGICGLLSHFSAVHVPLGLHQRLHYVLRTAEEQTHTLFKSTGALKTLLPLTLICHLTNGKQGVGVNGSLCLTCRRAPPWDCL